MIVSITDDGRKYFSDPSIVANTNSSRTSLFILDWTFPTDPSQYYQDYKTSYNGRDYTIVGYFSYDQKIKLIDSVDVFNARYEKIASIVDIFRPVGTKPVDIGNDQFYLSPADERLVDGGGDDYADLGDGNDVFYYVSGRDKIYGGAGLDMVEAAGFSHPSLSVAAAGDDWYDVRSGARLLFSTKYVELIAFGGFAARIEGDKVRFETAPGTRLVDRRKSRNRDSGGLHRIDALTDALCRIGVLRGNAVSRLCGDWGCQPIPGSVRSLRQGLRRRCRDQEHLCQSLRQSR